MIPPKLLFMRVSCINGLNEIWTDSHLDVFMTAISGPYTVSCMPVRIRERIHVRSQDNTVALVHVCYACSMQRGRDCMNLSAWHLHALICAWERILHALLSAAGQTCMNLRMHGSCMHLYMPGHGPCMSGVEFWLGSTSWGAQAA